ncbi:MAG: ABC transporter permease, partial [Treponema sp.]|nr:ABC transporter permease [Treponema sp.]
MSGSEKPDAGGAFGSKIGEFVADFGWPRLIIFFFVAALFIAAPFVGVKADSSLKDVLVRFGQNGVMVLAMVPMMQSGSGLNFGLPVGIVAGLLGSTLSMEFHFTGFAGFFMAVVFSLPLALVFGWLYGLLLNKVKVEEM